MFKDFPDFTMTVVSQPNERNYTKRRENSEVTTVVLHDMSYGGESKKRRTEFFIRNHIKYQHDQQAATVAAQ